MYVANFQIKQDNLQEMIRTPHIDTVTHQIWYFMAKNTEQYQLRRFAFSSRKKETASKLFQQDTI